MSIRAEDAAAEASRFSLRTSLFGDGAVGQAPTHAQPAATTVPIAATAAPQAIRALPMTPMASKAPTAPATSGTALTFSFNSINSQRGGAAQQQQQQKQLKARQTQETLQAIARIAQQQRSQPAPTPMMPTAPTNGGAGAHTLPSGFLNGGNQHVDAQAEVMRLAATVDSLNTKLGSQAERLQRTEASLVRANRAMTSERATANARLLRMQNEVKELKSRETSLRENALAQARRELQKTDAAFNESVKRAEEFDAKLTTLQDTIQALTAEREALSKQITGLTVELKQSTARAAGAEARLAEVPDPSVAEAGLGDARDAARKPCSAKNGGALARYGQSTTQCCCSSMLAAEATTARASADAAAAARQEAESPACTSEDAGGGHAAFGAKGGAQGAAGGGCVASVPGSDRCARIGRRR